MTDIAERYHRLSDAFTRLIAAVPPDRWDDPSPCQEWTAREVLGHVIDTQHSTAGYVDRTLSEGPPVTTEPIEAWTNARDGMRALLNDPRAARAEFDGMNGPTSLERVVDEFVCFDLLVHGWDIARATGGDERMDGTEIQRVHAQARGFADAFRGPGGFGPEVPVPDGADEQDRLLAFLGRQP